MNTISSDLHRAAEQCATNQQRLAAWRRRYELATGRKPVAEESVFARAVRSALCPWLRKATAINIAAEPPEPVHAPPAAHEAHTNATVVKFPRHRRQFIGAALPTGPDAA